MEFSKETHSMVESPDGTGIIQNDSILLMDKRTHEVVFVPIDEDVVQQFDEKLWTEQNTLFLISRIKAYDKEFSEGIKKNVWKTVSRECNDKFKIKTMVTPRLCENKWKSLKGTYKGIKINNETSGARRRHWQYYSVVDDIMFEKPEILPVATCSSMAGLQVTETPDAFGSSSSVTESGLDSSFSRKRKSAMNKADVRHKEKMARMDRFNELFEKMISKMDASTPSADDV